MARNLRSGLRQSLNAGLAGGFASNDIFTTASLDLNFAKYKNLGPLVDATTGTNLVDFSRASSGTYVGSDGLIKTATTNLLTWSEDFTNAVWQTTNPGEVTLVTGVADPLGGTSATTLFRDSGAGDTGFLRRISTGTIGLSYTFSFWIRRRSGSGDFNVVLGDNISQTVSGITSEWQRVSVSNTPTSTTIRTYFHVVSAGDEFDIFGAQLEQSSTVGEYIPTTSTINSAPRFNHDPTTGESLGLLVEESRTNDVYKSETIGVSAPWIRANLTHTTGLNAPDGTTNATQFLETIANDGHFVYWLVANALTTVTVSVFVKPIGREYIGIRPYTSANVWENVVFNVTGEGSVVNYQSGASSTYSNVQGFIKKHADGWYRISVTCTNTAGVQLPLVIQTHTTATPTLDNTGEELFVGDISKGFYAWGAQIENGSFPTSYIRNTTGSSAVTRAADVASISGSNFSSWANNTAGTVFSDSTILASSIQTQAVWQFRGGSVLTSLRQPHLTANQFRAVIGGTFTSSPGTGATLTTGTTKAAVAYSGGSGRLQVGSEGADASGSILDSNLIDVGSLAGSNNLNGHLRRLTFWPTRLPNSTLSTITQ